MRYLLLFVLLLTVCSCDEGRDDAPVRNKTTAKYAMDCSHRLNEDHDIYRCENDEAICYDHDEHLACKFKQP